MKHRHSHSKCSSLCLEAGSLDLAGGINSRCGTA
uniref:Uncharacterized protein n=1 Tax=Fagus sylvatica TaxID=28930 RepID=A0A2N9EG49_FAGSY